MSASQDEPKLEDKMETAPKFMIGNTEFKFEPSALDEEFQARAAKELRETPQNVEDGLRILRELLKGLSVLSWFSFASQTDNDCFYINEYTRSSYCIQ